MSHTAQADVAIGHVDVGVAGDLGSHPPGTLQELQDRSWGDVRPVDVLVRRTGEDDGGPHRVDAELVDLLAEINTVAQRLRHRPTLIDDLALVHETLERLGEVDHAEVVQHLSEEPRVQQVHGGVLDAADVLGDRHPTTHGVGVERPLVEVRRAVTHEVPGRVHEGVHGVGVTLGGLATPGTGDLSPLASLLTGER